MIQNTPNDFEWRALAQNNNNIMSYIFVCFDLVQWWESKEIVGPNQHPFEEVTDNS